MITDPKRKFKKRYKITKDILKEKEIIDTPLGYGVIWYKEKYPVYRRNRKGEKVSGIDFVFTIRFEALNYMGHEFKSIGAYNSYIGKLYEVRKKERPIYSCRRFREVKNCSECLRNGYCCLTSATGKDIIF